MVKMYHCLGMHFVPRHTLHALVFLIEISFHHTSHTFSFLLHYIMSTEALVLMRSSNMVGLNKNPQKRVCDLG